MRWGQIAGAKAVVEAGLPRMRVDPSQGSHFFHNLSSFEVCYFTAAKDDAIRWNRLEQMSVETETEVLRHVRLPRSLLVKVDGRSGRGVILLPPENQR